MIFSACNTKTRSDSLTHIVQRFSLFANHMQRNNGPKCFCGPQRCTSGKTWWWQSIPLYPSQTLGKKINTHTHTDTPTPPSALIAIITQTHGLKRQEGKTLCMQNKRAAYTQVRVSLKKERGTHLEKIAKDVCVRVGVFSCVMVAHFVVYESSLKLFKNADQSSFVDLMPASLQKE